MQVHSSAPPPLWRWLALVPALGCLSCSGGPALNPVHGQVLLKGKGIKGAVVTLHLQGADPVTAVRPYGLTGEDGTFTLTTGDKEGAPAGEYIVTVIWSREVAGKKGKEAIPMAPPDTEDHFHGAYADPTRSKIKVTIASGANKLDPIRLQ